MQKFVFAAVALISFNLIPSAKAEGIFAYECSPHNIVGYQPSGYVKEKIYVKSDLSIAAYSHSQTKNGATKSYKVALSAAFPLNPKVPLMIYEGEGYDVVEMKLDIASVSVTLSRYPDAEKETFPCEPTSLGSFDWKDAEEAATDAKANQQSAIFDLKN